MKKKDIVITPKEIYDSLWKCRDFELSHLWQRSVFLSAFLIMCFTGYGSVLFKICEYSPGSSPDDLFCVLNIIGIAVALLGYVFSVLWIMMGKGSKAWYERYESALYNIERDSKFSKSKVYNYMNKHELMHGSIPFPEKLDNKLFSTNAGAFSVSRINIAIGQISMIVWCFIYLIHTCLFSFSDQLSNIIGCHKPGTVIMSIIISFLLWIITYILLKYTKWCESSNMK
ncbi:MAG: hypothetical protein PUB21_10885 [Bacteroidales bacterium]|nr:hypothetical protein [Bacteroidales bacterium]